MLSELTLIIIECSNILWELRLEWNAIRTYVSGFLGNEFNSAGWKI